MAKKKLTLKLQNAGVKPTAHRIQVLDVLESFEWALSLKQLSASTQMDRITLYRTLRTLEAHGLIHLARETTHDKFYALCKDHCGTEGHKHAHVHFECLSCHSVRCVESSVLTEQSLPGLKVAEWNVQASGWCADCVKPEAASV
ncbi:MAG: Uncharacterised protein [Flavobacteriia bacterium]|nr:MAG: Uncharacterised protein [Flavobacteriia bacterium]